MNSGKAKDIKLSVYGTDLSPKFRKYTRLPNGMIIADEKRREYQKKKKEQK